MPNAYLKLLIAALAFVAGCATTTFRNFNDQLMLASNGKPLLLNKADLPLPCISHPNVQFEDLKHYREAAAEYNDGTGIELLEEFCIPWMLTNYRFPTKPVQGHVLVKIGLPVESYDYRMDGLVIHSAIPHQGHAVGLTVTYISMRNPNEIYGIMVYIDPKVRNTKDVWRHELGHVLGLAHDENDQNSLMYPILQKTPGTIMQEDFDALRANYGDFPY